MADAWVRLPLGAVLNGTVRQLVERPSSILGVCGFDSHLCHSGSFFQRRGYQVVNLAMRVRFPYEPLLSMARSSSGRGRQVLNL